MPAPCARCTLPADLRPSWPLPATWRNSEGRASCRPISSVFGPAGTRHPRCTRGVQLRILEWWFNRSVARMNVWFASAAVSRALRADETHVNISVTGKARSAANSRDIRAIVQNEAINCYHLEYIWKIINILLMLKSSRLQKVLETRRLFTCVGAISVG